jgi:hypothetical protein
MTWAEQRRQFGRLVQKGMALEQVKQLLLRCQKCVTKWLKESQESLA